MSASTYDIHELCSAARLAAVAAGEILVRGFSEAKIVTNKGGNHNLVTQFDVASEQCIIDALRQQFPDSLFLAEESGGSDVPDGLRWIIDPLDGTVNFAHGIPVFSVSIAAEVSVELVDGFVYQPQLREMFTAVKGHGAWCNDARISVSGQSRLEDWLLVTGFPYDVHDNAPHTLENFARLVTMGVPVRRLGSAALDLAYVAAGRFDGFWESALKPWDVAAGVLLVLEAGGRVTEYSGAEHTLTSPTILATNTAVHADFVAFLDRN
ncbi:MAG: inositol monophosphatase family protein [Candidatus Kapaibacterium sp.]